MTNKKILLADDEPQLALAIKIRLQSRGYQVTTASDGRQALDAIAKERPDLVLLDVLMPVMDGYQLYHLLKEQPRTKHVPVIMVTGGGDLPDQALGLEAPAYNYVTKPVRVDELLQKIRAVLPATPPPA